MLGDVLKVYHFTGARRKRHYMYRQVVGSRDYGDGTILLKVSRLTLDPDEYYWLGYGRHDDVEIVQSVECDHEDRRRI